MPCCPARPPSSKRTRSPTLIDAWTFGLLVFWPLVLWSFGLLVFWPLVLGHPLSQVRLRRILFSGYSVNHFLLRFIQLSHQPGTSWVTTRGSPSWPQGKKPN